MTTTTGIQVNIQNAAELAYELIRSGKLDDVETAIVIDTLTQVATYWASGNDFMAEILYDRLAVTHSALIG